ncbi:MAG: glycosyltransferase family 2 protein [Phycisphaeraceae bacterium]|nr:glycosyltransferase family 2 protein [Phycisphaerales bacterium]MCB9860039.1 glycosyltransferase family 2 protein [Phycisphaeraceae bacterium]
MRVLVAIPVYNEAKYVTSVLERVRQHATNILVIDDGSTDDTPTLVSKQPVEVIRHAVNRGYGRSLRDAFRWGSCYDFDWVLTMDCDEQHEPERIGDFLEAMHRDDTDIISGSRYLAPEAESIGAPPQDRKAINRTITHEINERLGSRFGAHITDAFCGFKAHHVSAMKKLKLTETGYAFPMQFWVQAAANNLRITEIPVTLIYNDPSRSFGGVLDDAQHRLAHYRSVLHDELRICADKLPAEALVDIAEPVVTTSCTNGCCRR